MIVKLILIISGLGFGILMTIILLRKDIFKVINYHNGLPDIEDIDDPEQLYFFNYPKPRNPEND